MIDDAIRDAKMKAAAALAAESHDAFMTATPSQLKAIMDANTQRRRDIAEQQAAWEAQRLGVPQWQPIETAPIEGGSILVWDGHDVLVGTPIEPSHFMTEGYSYPRSEFTHWMPLPEPPK